MKRIAIVLALLLAAPGCAVKFSAELLNPLNKSGRVEKSEPVSTPAPTPEVK